MLSSNIKAVIKNLSEAQNASFIVEREASNYELFFQLYKKIGYVPDNIDYETWKNNTAMAWNTQDMLLPFSCTGGFYKGRLVSSLGTLPISQNVMYGHSFCMLKSLHGILTMAPQMVRSAFMVEKMPDTGFYAGSYKNASRFTSKLHMVADNSGQIVIQSLDLSPSIEGPTLLQTGYKLLELKDTNGFSESVLTLLNLFGSAHESLKDVHKINHYLVSTDEGQPKAVVIYHSSLPGFTAIDIFDRSWIIMLDNQDGKEVCNFLRSLHEFKHQTFELLNSDYGSMPRYSGPDSQTPRQWVFTPKASVKLAMPLLLQTIISLVAKFPEEEVIKASEELLGAQNVKPNNHLNSFFAEKAKDKLLIQNSPLKAKL